MKSNNKKIENIIMKKTSTYLKNAILIFLITIASFIFGVLFFWNQMNENEKNFMENEKVHFIQITGRVEDKTYVTLTNKDINKISTIEREVTNKFDEVVMYEFVGAVEELTEEPVKIVAIDKSNYKYLSKDEMKESVFYTNEPVEGTSYGLLCPKLESDDQGNIVSRENVEIQYDLKNVIKSENESGILAIRNSMESLPMVFVTHESMLSILQKAGILDVSIDNIQQAANIGPKDIFIYVEDVYDIDKCASKLQDNGYMINYVFDNFDSFSDSLKKSTIFIIALVVMLLITSAFNVLLSFNNYLKVQQKDMGILKFFGYSEKQIYSMYKGNIRKIFVLCFGILAVYTILVLWAMDMINAILNIFTMIGLVGGILAIVYMLIVRLILKKLIEKDILFLIKYSKEFE